MSYNEIILNGISIDDFLARLKSELQSTTPATDKTSEPEEQFLTAKETAQLLGVSLVSIHKWKKAGKLRFYRFGSRIRFKRNEVFQIEKYGRAAK